MIENFIESTLVIDEKPNEVEKLIALLEKKDILVKYLTPDKLGKNKLKNRKIIFLDLFLDDSKSLTDNISFIRSKFNKSIGRDFGSYGLVLWTNHEDKTQVFREKIQKDSGNYSLPLFIIGLSKQDYLRKGDFTTLFVDLNNKLKKDVAANFFITWSTLVTIGRDKSIEQIYSLIGNYRLRNDNLKYVLFQLAKNITGIPIDQIEEYSLHIDAFRALNDMMNYQITAIPNIESNLFDSIDDLGFVSEKGYKKTVNEGYKLHDNLIDPKDKDFNKMHSKKIGELNKEISSVFASLNSRYLFDAEYLDQDKIIPGNIYEIKKKGCLFRIKNLPVGSTPIIIEMTPPCDFSQNRSLYSKILSGFIVEHSENKLKKSFSKSHYYNEIHPIKFGDDNKIKIMVFDFNYFGVIDQSVLRKPRSYKLISRAKEKLFADILQKVSSHNSRLGVSIIH